MAVVLNLGSGGATCGTDTVSGTDYQICKIGFSVSGTAPTQTSASNPLPSAAYFSGTAASVNTGNADAGTLRVVLATNQPSLSNAQPVTQSGSWTVTANAGTGTFSISGQLADAATFTRGTTVTTPIAGIAETSAPSLTTGKAATFSLNLSGGLRVDGSGVTQPVSGTFWQATQPVSGTVTANAGTGTFNIQSNASVNVAQVNGITVLTGTGASGTGTQRVSVANDSEIQLWDGTNGPVAVKAASTAAVATDKALVVAVSPNNTVGVTGTFWQSTQPVSGTVTANAGTGTFLTQPVAGTANGATPFSAVSAASNNLQAVKSSAAGTVYSVTALNLNANPRFVKFFDVATTGGVTMGTTAAIYQAPLPGNTSGAGIVVTLPVGLKFSNGIMIAITGGISLTDNTAILASEVTVNIAYA